MYLKKAPSSILFCQAPASVGVAAFLTSLPRGAGLFFHFPLGPMVAEDDRASYCRDQTYDKHPYHHPSVVLERKVEIHPVVAHEEGWEHEGD